MQMTKEHPQIHSLALSERHIFVKIMDEKRRRRRKTHHPTTDSTRFDGATKYNMNMTTKKDSSDHDIVAATHHSLLISNSV
mmetsp:Transcript_9495/g.14153  ORF Transcript_9495/g.14153 Transcript_9495/m.14153 type:complete len:81 (-) Transcript_9495:65-307(-)